MQKKVQLCLAIDTASDVMSVACVDSTGAFAVVQEAVARGQGELLMDMILDVLKRIGKRTKDLTCVAVTIGPGSFTGVRIGLATARGLGLALNIPVLGVDNFCATAYDLSYKVKVVLDTRRDDYFVQDFDERGNVLGQSHIMTVEQLKNLLPFVACGSGAAKLAEEVGCQVVLQDKPVALSVARIALESPDKTVPPHPLYLREADVTI